MWSCSHCSHCSQYNSQLIHETSIVLATCPRIMIPFPSFAGSKIVLNGFSNTCEPYKNGSEWKKKRQLKNITCFMKHYLKEHLDCSPFRVGIKPRKNGTGVHPETPEKRRAGFWGKEKMHQPATGCPPFSSPFFQWQKEKNCSQPELLFGLLFPLFTIPKIYFGTKKTVSPELVRLEGNLETIFKSSWATQAQNHQPLFMIQVWEKIFSCFLILQDLRRLSLSLLVGTL